MRPEPTPPTRLTFNPLLDGAWVLAVLFVLI